MATNMLSDPSQIPTQASRGNVNTKVDVAFQQDVLAGLKKQRKELPGKYFYDRRGADLFDAIQATSAYDPTRIEMLLLKACARNIADLVGEGASVVEIGGCDTQKARLLLGAMKSPLVYMPIDVSSQHLWSAAMQLQLDYPYLAVRPVHADFTTITDLPEDGPWIHEQATFLFFGSTFGKFDPFSAAKILGRVAGLTLRNLLVIGVDLKKDRELLEKAYNDRAGFTAEFNLSLLLRANRELGTDFDLGSFSHEAFFNEKCDRVEMHLRSLKKQKVHIDSDTINFEAGETIHTGSAYKYGISQFHRLAGRAGYLPIKAWTDPDHLFSLHVLCKTN